MQFIRDIGQNTDEQTNTADFEHFFICELKIAYCEKMITSSIIVLGDKKGFFHLPKIQPYSFAN
ncbi:hypothetical protein NC99_35170 [Sunxiuqinia dokdonensis]|uniref:Uncharacterized protein n=1 Tax=Sunxiuqinia dokdonensis TaxID=1409788 RepID=A0A0L8V5W5_9BACT|nr:hypothetical protein NC99_35170 [Sunxiuqinia dokdonensis]